MGLIPFKGSTMFFSRFTLAFALLTSLVSLANAQVTLTFDQSGGVIDSILIDQTYGDRVVSSPDSNGHLYGVSGSSTTPNVEASYSALDPNLWTTGYGDLTNVYYDETDFSDGFSLTLTADAGFEVGLFGFDAAAFFGDEIAPEVAITDGNGNVLWSQTNAEIDSTTHTSFDFVDGIFANSLSIEIDLTGLGGSSDNIGIDNISFVQQTAAVPEPSSLLLVWITGIGVASIRRRR